MKRDLSISRECQKNHSRAGVDISELPLLRTPHEEKKKKKLDNILLLPPVSDFGSARPLLVFPQKVFVFSREKKTLSSCFEWIERRGGKYAVKLEYPWKERHLKDHLVTKLRERRRHDLKIQQ